MQRHVFVVWMIVMTNRTQTHHSCLSCRFGVVPQQTEEHGDAASVWSGHQRVHSEAAAAPHAPAREAGPGLLQGHDGLVHRPADSGRDSPAQQPHRAHAGRWVLTALSCSHSSITRRFSHLLLLHSCPPHLAVCCVC